MISRKAWRSKADPARRGRAGPVGNLEQIEIQLAEALAFHPHVSRSAREHARQPLQHREAEQLEEDHDHEQVASSDVACEEPQHTRQRDHQRRAAEGPEVRVHAAELEEASEHEHLRVRQVGRDLHGLPRQRGEEGEAAVVVALRDQLRLHRPNS